METEGRIQNAPRSQKNYLQMPKGGFQALSRDEWRLCSLNASNLGKLSKIKEIGD